MIDKEVFKELLREAFQDFDLLDYTYSLKFQTGIKETNNDGSLKWSPFYDDYEEFYKKRVGKKIKVTYKNYIELNLHFTPNVIFNKEEFFDFFEDGMTKLNYLLEKNDLIFMTFTTNRDYVVEKPINIETICGYIDISKRGFWFNNYIYGEELQLLNKYDVPNR
jgi:hypothetical protein